MAYFPSISIADMYEAVMTQLRALNRPPWQDPTTKQLKTQTTLLSGTVTTVTTVSGVTNIGGVTAFDNHIRPAQKMAWTTNIRNRIS